MIEETLVLQNDREIDSFQLEMLHKNRVPGILPIRAEKNSLIVESKGYLPLDKYLRSHTLTVKTFKMLLECFMSILEDSLMYYLDKNNFLIACDKLFVSNDIQSMAVVYLPIKSNEDHQSPLKKFVFEVLLMNGKFNMEEDWNFMILGLNALNTEPMEMKAFGRLHELFKLDAGPIVPLAPIEEEIKEEKIEKRDILSHLQKLFSGKKNLIPKEENLSKGKTVLLRKKPSGLQLIAENDKVASFNIYDNNLVIGRQKHSVDVLLKDAGIGKFHAEIVVDNGKYYLRDLNSLNGSYLNSVKLKSYESNAIRIGDRIQFADIGFKVADTNG